MRGAILLALAAIGAFVWWRSPPKRVVRLDSGSDNGGFTLGDDNRLLFYATHGVAHDIVNSVDLATGRTASRRLWGRRLKAVAASYSGNRVKLIADNGDRAPKDGRYSLISLNGNDWTIRREEPRPTGNGEDLALFDTPYQASTEPARTPGMRDDYGVSTRISQAGLEVRLRVDDKLRPAKLYPTISPPSAFAYDASGNIVVAYPWDQGRTRLEEIAPTTGKRRTILDLRGAVESMGVAGDGLVAVRTAPGDTRLSFVSLSQSKELLDLDWSKGGSTLLGDDPIAKKLYFSMAVRGPDGWIQETGWSVPMDLPSLRAAGKFFSAMHEWPELRWKLIGHSVEILIAVFVLGAGWYFYGTMREI
jgi:hypothetical protein